MSRLGDILIEHGPITQDYVASPGLSSDMRWIRAAELNALRNELLELRQLRQAVERLSRYEVDLNRWTDPVELSLNHDCPRWSASLADSVTLAELVRRADQHTQDCP